MRISGIILILVLLCGCTSYQPTKNVWKGTKQLWATYVSPPADVDYDDKGTLSPQADRLARSMLGVDKELSRLERVMQNSDKPPTMEWLERLFANFPWLSGFAGVKYDGSILGQQPADSLKELDFNYLLHEDEKQKSRSLRADVQPSPLGPEVMIAAPLYDGIDFLGIVVAYFDMRALMGFSDNPQDIVVLTPTALLWPGKYDFAATPLSGVEWSKVVRESSAGTCSNATGTFFYMVRYFANLPMIFAVPQSGNFPEGNGGIEQGFAYFPSEREKGTPPPVSEERLKREAEAKNTFGQSEETLEAGFVPERTEQAVSTTESGPSPNDLQPGSRESVLLENRRQSGRQVEERQLEGENVQVERVQRPRRRPPAPVILPDLDLEPEPQPEPPVVRRPSPFGPRHEEQAEQSGQPQRYQRPSPFGPRESVNPVPDSSAPTAAQDGTAVQPPVSAPAESSDNSAPASTVTPGTGVSDQQTPPTTESGEFQKPAAPPTLPGGRPSPFGPRTP